MDARLLRPAPRVALAAILALALASPAFACSCGSRPSVEDARAASAAVFTGIPVSIVGPVPGDTGGDRRVTFRVTAIWKGDVTATYSVVTGDGPMCGVNFNLGEEWLVYAFPHFNAPEVFTHICSRTARSAGNPDIAALGPPLTTPGLAGSWGWVKAQYR
jgi:hypothetical protein